MKFCDQCTSEKRQACEQLGTCGEQVLSDFLAGSPATDEEEEK